MTATDQDLEWCLVSDGELNELTAARFGNLADAAASLAAGSSILTGSDADERTVFVMSVAQIPGFEVAVDVDVKTGKVTWAFRHAPDRCEGCGVRVEEGGYVTDSEGVILCSACETLL